MMLRMLLVEAAQTLNLRNFAFPSNTFPCTPFRD